MFELCSSSGALCFLALNGILQDAGFLVFWGMRMFVLRNTSLAF